MTWRGVAARGRRVLAMTLAVYLLSATVLAVLPTALADTPAAPVPTEDDDPHSLADLVDWLEEHGLSAATAPTAPVGPEHALTSDVLDPLVAQVVAEWQATVPEADLSGLSVSINDLPDLQLGSASGTAIQVDVDAAGHGWSATFPAEEAGEHMDLLTVVRHEIGHVLGREHTDAGLMASTLSVGEVHGVPAPESTTDSTTDGSTSDDGTTDGSTADGATSDDGTTDDGTTDGSTSEDSTTDGAATDDGTTSDGGATDEGTADGTTSDDGTTQGTTTGATEPVTAWTIDGTTATLTATSVLDHVLRHDAAAGTVALVDATGAAATLSLDGIDTIVVLGTDGDDHLALDLDGPLPVSATYDAGAGTDTLAGPSVDATWSISGAGSGTVAGVVFAGVEDLAGAAGNEDTFVVEAAGSIAGVVAGGDGGFDVIELAGGDFAQVDFVATGPQSGTITRDGDVLTYTGMEPITSDTNTPVQTISLTGADDEVEIRDGTAADGEFDVVVVNGTAESVTVQSVDTIEELIIDLAGGLDLLRFVSVDSLFTGIITIVGGADADTFEVPDVAATWRLDGVDSGTYQAADETGPEIGFGEVEHLVGASTHADDVDFGTGAGLSGTFTDGTGDLTVSLAGFVKVTGDYDFVSDDTYTAQVVPASGGTATGTVANLLTVGESSGTGFLGTDPLDNPVGLQGALSDFGLAIVTTTTEAYHAFSGTLDAEFVGGDILSIPLTTMTVSVNARGADDTFLDLSAAPVTAGTQTLAFATSLVEASMTATLSIDDFVHVSGDLTFARGGNHRVDVATGLPSDLTGLASDLVAAIEELPEVGDAGITADDIQITTDLTTILNLPVAVMTVSVVDAAIFVGYNPGWVDADGDDRIDPGELDADAIGLYANDIDLGFAKLSPRPTEYRLLNRQLPGFTAMKLSIGTIEFVGIDEITISASQLLVEVNNGSTWPGGLGPPVVDFAASFPAETGDTDGDGTPDEPAGLQVGDVYLDYDGNQRFGVSSDQVVLTLGDFVHLAGGFAFTKGPTEKVDIATGLGAVVGEAYDALPTDLKNAIEGMAGATTEPSDDSTATIKSDDFSVIWNVEVTTLQFGVSDVNVFVGYNPTWVDADGDHVIDLDELGGDAVGLYASDIDLGFVSMTPTLASLPGFDDLLPTWFALKATADNLSLQGIPEVTVAALDSVLKINSGTPWTGTPYTSRVDWAASFPDDPDGGGPATSGYLIETGGDPVVIDFDGVLLTEVSSDTVVFTLGDFVHVSGGFSYREGVPETVEVATGLPANLAPLIADNPALADVKAALDELTASSPGTGITVKDDYSTIWNVPVGTLQVGFSDVNVFLGYNPGWVDVDGDHRIDMAEPDIDGDGWDAATDDRDGDGVQDVDELGTDAIGLYAFDIDVAIVFMTPSVTGFDIDQYLPSFTALKASADNLSLVGIPDVTVSATDVLIEVNDGDAWPGGIGPPVVNFEASFPAETSGDDDGDGIADEPVGYQVDTGGAPIYLDYDGNQRIGVRSPEIILTLGGFVHVTGGLAFQQGPTESVDVATGLPADVITAAQTSGFGDLASALSGLDQVADDAEADGDMAISNDYSYLYNLEVATLQFGVSDVNVFIGYGLDWTDVDGDHRIDRAEADASDDRDEDGNLDVDEFGDTAVGLYAFDVDLGFALMTPTLASLPGFDQFFPNFYALKASADELSVVGVPEITMSARGIRVEVNGGGNWGGTPWGGVIDWQSSFAAETGDTDGDGIPDEPAGYQVDTGRDPIYLDYEGQALIGGGADLVVIGLSEFVHLRGSIYFEQGTVLTVPLTDGIVDTSLLEDVGLTGDVLDAVSPASGEKELEFLNIGGQDLYAFVGVGGPHWTTEDSDLTSDLVFECEEGQTCTTGCAADGNTADGHADAEEETNCVLTLNGNAIGLAVSDLDMALTIGTPTNLLDPTRYITLRASVDDAGLVGLEDEGLTATVRGVELEVNMSTPTVSGLPLLPVIDWKQYATDNGCVADDFAAGEAVTVDCEPFGVKTGRLDASGDPITEDFFYDSLLVRASVEMLELDVLGVLVVRGSVAFVLGPTADVTLTDVDETVVTGVTTMTLGGENLFGFIGVGGPHWLENAAGDIIYSIDTDGDGWGDGVTECDPGDTDCEVEPNSSAVGIALTDLDFGLFVGTKVDPTNPAAFVAADINLDKLSLLGVPGVTAEGLLAIALNLGFTLSAAGGSAAGINFRKSFKYDSDGDGDVDEDDADGFALETGGDPMILTFEDTFVEAELAGTLDIVDVARLDGLFYLGIDLDAGEQELRLLALAEMTIGPDIGTSGDPLVSIGALGVLILNEDGVAGDFTVNLDLNVPLVTVDVDARVVFNSSSTDQVLELPDRLLDRLEKIENGTLGGGGLTEPGPLVTALLNRLEACPGDTSGDTDCYIISGNAPSLISVNGGIRGPDNDTIDALLGDDTKTISTDGTGPYVVVVLSGELDLVGFASASGTGAIAISDSGGFELVLDVVFQLGPSANVALNVEVQAVAEITNTGFYLFAHVGLDANLLSLFDVDVSGTLEIDTNPGSEIFLLDLNGSMTLLGIVEFDANVLIYVGGALGEDAWYFGGSLRTDFGPLEFTATAFITSWGSFLFDGSAEIDISIAGTGIEGELSAHLSYCAHETSGGEPIQACHDDVNRYRNGDGSLSLPSGTIAGLGGVTFADYVESLKDTDPQDGVSAAGRDFLVEVSGSVKVKVFGITLLGVGANAKVWGSLGDRVTLKVTVTVETIFGDVEEDIEFGTFYLPDTLINSDFDPDLATQNGSTLTLNVGDRADQRAVAQDDEQEWYTITQEGGDVTVRAFGFTETFSGIDTIVGDFGTDLDKLTVGSGVTADLDISGGPGDDELSHNGSGTATLDGNDGDDKIVVATAPSTLTGGAGNDELFGGSAADSLDGGLGDDLIVGGAGLDTLLGGPSSLGTGETDDDVFRGSDLDLAGETLNPGAGYDRLEVFSDATAHAVTLGIVAGVLELAYPAGTIDATGINQVAVLLQGGDHLTIDGSVRTDAPGSDSLDSIEVAFTDVDPSEDDVTLGLSSGDDLAALAATTGATPTTTVDWNGLLLEMFGYSLDTGDRDTLTVQALGGDDHLAVTGLQLDTTLDLGAGDDVVAVGSAAACTSLACTNDGGDVEGIDAPLAVVGGAGTDRLEVDDSADTTGDTLTLTDVLVDGLDLHAEGITYGGLEFLDLDLGGGGDHATVVSTHTGQTTLDTFGGSDTVLIRTIGGHTLVTTGAADDVVTVGSAAAEMDGIAALLEVSGQGGDDDLVVDDSGEADDDIGIITDDTISGLGATIDAGHDPADAVHVVTITDAQDGTFTLTVDGATTTPLDFDAEQDEVRDALLALSLGLTATDVTVSRTSVLRTSGITYRITFTGTFAGQAGRDLGPITVDDTGLVDTPTGTAAAVVTAMTDGRVLYDTFETLDVDLGSGVDHVTLVGTSAASTLDGGAGDDVLDVEDVSHETRLNGQAGDDQLTVNALPESPEVNRISAPLTLDGGADTDTTWIQLAGTDESHIDVVDTGGDLAPNRLVVEGSEADDQFLLRRDLVALLNSPDADGAYQFAEYITYGSGISSLTINTLGGADHVAFDDNSTTTTVNGGDGADTFQVGQLFGEECLDDATGNADGDACFDSDYMPPALIDTTQGMLSNGISVVTTVNGGTGEDLFLVFRNRAVLNANGEAGNDTFVIRTFLEEDSETQVTAGEGADTINYVTNAPVNINGGDGFDTLFVIGTEADDTFVITDAGVYGAGRYVSFVAIERLGIDAAEGNDHITVLATAPGLAVEVYGGLGSDTIDVGGDAPVAAADDLLGHSGLITHSVESTTGVWDDVVIDGIAAEVADDDEPAIVLTESGGSTLVYESDGTWTDTYTITLTRAPTSDVRIDVTTAELTPDQLDARARNVQVSRDGVTWTRAVALLFTTTNWATPQTIHVRAEHDIAAEGEQTTIIQHAVTSDGEYDELPMNVVGVRVIDDEVAEVVIVETGVDTVVGEDGTTDTWTVGLSGAPTADVDVTITAPVDVCLSTATDANADCGDLVLTFTPTSYGPVTVTATAVADGTVEGFAFARVEHVVSGDVAAVVTVLIADADTPDVLVTESDGATQVAEGVDLVDSYEVVLTSDPGTEVVTFTATSLPTLTQYDPEDGSGRTTREELQVELSLDGVNWSSSVSFDFDTNDWDASVTVFVRALDDTVIDGSLLQAFPERANRVHRIQGSLLVAGGPSPFGYPLEGFEPVLLPGEASSPNFITPNPAFDVDESVQVDTLRIDNSDSVSDDALVVTASTVTGLGMGPEGITYSQLSTLECTIGDLCQEQDPLDARIEDLEILLGRGDDDVDVVTTHTGTTTIRGNDGDDTIDVVDIDGHTSIDGDAGDDTFTVTDDGLLAEIDAQLLISGGDGDDTVVVDDTADATGDLGTLTQTSLVGLDMVGETGDDLYSLEPAGDLTGITLRVVVAELGLDVTVELDAVDLASLTAATLTQLLQDALFPPADNADPGETLPGDDDRFATTGCGLGGTTGERDSRCADSVYVWDSGGRLFLVGFRGELSDADVEFWADPIGDGTATDLLRADGITYDTLETLDIRLGEGHDRFNVRGTLPHTLLDTGPGDDVVYVSDAADLGTLPEALDTAADLEELHELALHGTVVYDDLTFRGTLDEVDGDLDIDTGSGSNTLSVSDHASEVADTGFTISDDTIAGLADGTMTYTSTGGDLGGQGHWPRRDDAGMFGRGITIHLGTGDDVGTIASVRGHAVDTPLQLTVTTVHGNDGDDTLIVDAPDVRDTDGTLLARLVVYGDDGDDAIDGTDATLPLIVFGEDGNDDLQGGTDDDVLFGDDGRVVLYRDTAADGAGDVYDVWLGGTKAALPDSVNPGTSIVGDAYDPDTVFETIDVIVTVFLDETDRDDIVRGGHGDDVVIGGVGDDGLDGEADRDVVIGDRVILTRNMAMTSPIVRTLDGTTLLDGVTGDHQLDPNGPWAWTITLLDHSTTTGEDRWGNDVAAGGADEDVVFGQLGDDLLHGDGVLNVAGDGFLDVTAVDTTTDGDDHVEGNGGADTIFGGLGQDDLIGGSSDLFGLTTDAMRPDDVDTVHGGNGDHEARNDTGLSGDDAHSRDADVLLGDNGRVFRIVGTEGTSTGTYLTFTYDEQAYAGTERVVPRVVDLLDYSPVGEDYWLAYPDPSAPTLVTVPKTNIGEGDFLHGEASDDIVYGATGRDAIFGEGGNDDLFGGANRDWISGGTGSDGIVSDHGWLTTNLHGFGEDLYGIDALPASELDKTIDTPGDLQSAVVNQTGTLHKAVELDLVTVTVEIDGQSQSITTFYVGDHDIAYGGLGDDFLHGGEGDDMLSGAEALALYYTDDPIGLLQTIYPYFDSDAGILQHGVVREGEFRCYDEFNPLAQVFVCDEDAQPLPGAELYLTNNDESEDDGADVIFGDGGNDWIVGGVDHDRAFGGWGDDLLDMDDDKSTNGGANDAPDAQTAPPTHADIAYGGAGRDVLIANTGADRLIDWVGEYNSYLVPFSPYGAFTISRSLAPHLFEYLYDLSEAEGADVTRGGDVSRNGEPYGELGLVTQKDDFWQDQTGAPADPQAGNTQGKRDVLREEDFTSASSATTAFAVDSGDWTVANGRYESVAVTDADAVSLFYVDQVLPTTYEVLATVNSDKNKAGYRSNAYIVFDYFGPGDFKFAGLEIGTDKVEIGRRTAAGWQVLASANVKLHPNRDYDLRLWVDGQVVTLYVDGVEVLSYDYGSPLLIAGDPSTAADPLTDGMIGVASHGAISRVGHMSVQVPAPPITLTLTDEFAAAPDHDTSGGTWTADAGTWTGTPGAGAIALSTTSLTVAPSALLVLDTLVTTDAVAGVAFDLSSPDRFKFAVLDTAAGQVLIGHVAAGRWVVDASFAAPVTAGTDHVLTVRLDGTLTTVLVDGEQVGTHVFHSLLNDGDVGLLATDGPARYQHLTLATDDPALEPSVPFVSVADAEVLEGNSGTTDLVATVTLSRAAETDVTVDWSLTDGTATGGVDYDVASGTLTILAGQLTGTVMVSIVGDTLMEDDETLFLHLASPTGAIVGGGSALLTIRNDDVDVVLDLAATDADASEVDSDPGTFTLTRTGSTAGELEVHLDWAGTADFAVDYTVEVTGGTLSSDGRTLTIADGADTVTLTVAPLTDDLGEVTEEVVLAVLADADYGVGDGTATMAIADDSALPVLSVSDAEVVEGDRGGTWVELAITLDAPAGHDVTVEVRTYGDTATSGEDFRSEVTTVTLGAGSTTATVRIRILSDRTRELDETLTVELSNPTGAVLGDAVGTVTILDDDGARLTAAGVPTGTPGATLSTGDVATLLPEARAWWRAHGVDTALLDQVTVRVIDLPGRTLAVVSGDRILVDPTAAGFGWSLTSEDPGMDLLTVLVHELGHALGHEHGEARALGGVMAPFLRAGERLDAPAVRVRPATVDVDRAATSSATTTETASVTTTSTAGWSITAPSGPDRRSEPGSRPLSVRARVGTAATTGLAIPVASDPGMGLLVIVVLLLAPAVRPTATRHDRAHWTA